MSLILGTKKEMTQIFDLSTYTCVPCTIIEVDDVYVCAKRTEKKDGYNAIVLCKGKKKKNINKAEKSKYKKLGFVPRYVKEVRVDNTKLLEEYKIGDQLSLKHFKVNDLVNVSGKTKGKGFQGVVKKFRFKGGPRTRGQSDRERAPGSIGGGTDPGRVYKGKKMPGHMGDKKKTIMNLKISKILEDKKLICIKGSVPGHVGSLLKIVKS